MSIQEGIVRPPQTTTNEAALAVILVTASVLFLGPLTLGVAAYFCYWLLLPRRGRELALSYGGMLVSVCIGVLIHDTLFTYYRTAFDNLILLFVDPDAPRRVLTNYIAISITSTPLIPAVTGGLLMTRHVRRWLRLYKTTEEWKQEREAEERRREAALEQLAREQAIENAEHTSKQGELYLGVRLGGESIPTGKQSIGVVQRGRDVYVQSSIIPEHGFVMGASGSGKTTTLKRLLVEHLKHTVDDVIVVDGKGDNELAIELQALIYKHRDSYLAPIVRLDPEREGVPSSSYHGFCGDADAILNRLAVMAGTINTTNAGQDFYAYRNLNILSLICLADCGPPRSFEEVRERLSLSWLVQAYRDDARELAQVGTLKQAQIDELGVKLHTLARLLRNVVSEQGFKLEETRAAIFSLDTLSNKDTARRFCEFFIEDFKNYVNRRAPRRGLLIIDEFGAFGNENIKDLLSMARSRGWGVWLLTQDYANLGDAQQAQQVTANCNTICIMQTNYPEAIATLAGTKLQVEGSIQRGPEGPTGSGSDRLQHTYRIDPNAVRRAPKGKTWVYRWGYEVQVQISPVQLSQEELAAVRKAQAAHQQAETTRQALRLATELDTTEKEAEQVPEFGQVRQTSQVKQEDTRGKVREQRKRQPGSFKLNKKGTSNDHSGDSGSDKV